MKIYLKMKVKTLAVESMMIHAAQRRIKRRVHKKGKTLDPAAGSSAFWGMQHHRIEVVRREARSSLLAYGFLRGRLYGEIENNAYTKPDFKRVFGIIERFRDGPEKIQDITQRFAEWRDTAEAHLIAVEKFRANRPPGQPSQP